MGWRDRDQVRHLGALVAVGAAYYLGARLGLSLSLVDSNVTPLWPPTGIAVAAFLLLGMRMWPAVALAAFAVNLPISEGVLPAVVTAVGNVLAPVVAVALLHRVGFRRELDRQRDALAIVFLAALASMTISATIGACTLVLSGVITSDELPGAWAVWWTGDAMGVLAVAPFLLCLPLFWERRSWPPARWLELGTILVLVGAVTAWTATSDLHLLFLVLPVLAWAAWRLQLRGAAPAALIASLIATWSAAEMLGPFEQGSLSEQMLTLQAFNACVALTSFFLASLVTERLRAAEELRAVAAEEHHIAETLQRSLLPDRLPEIAGVSFAARYVPATADVQVGGDWYDVVELPKGLIALAIGDVAGHGLGAAATMGQLRMGLRAYALQDPSPAAVMTGLHRLVSHLPMPEMVTVLYLVFDPATRRVRFSNAGHPPALVVGPSGSYYLDAGLAPPVGVTAEALYPEVEHDLEPGATLLLYTDGLVERRGRSIQDDLERLRLEASEHAGRDLENLCDSVLAALLDEGQVADDVALVVMRAVALVDAPLSLKLPADPRTLVQLRGALRRWLRESGVEALDEQDILVACGEACANVVQHAYGATSGEMVVEGRLSDGAVELLVGDQGEWRPEGDRDGGWGLHLIRSLMDSVEVHRNSTGTEVRMRRLLRTEPSNE